MENNAHMRIICKQELRVKCVELVRTCSPAMCQMRLWMEISLWIGLSISIQSRHLVINNRNLIHE